MIALGKISAEHCDVTVATRDNLKVPPHRHDTTNYLLITAGTLYLTLDGAEHEVCSGDWCTIPAFAEHAERFEEKTSLVVFWVRT